MASSNGKVVAAPPEHLMTGGEIVVRSLSDLGALTAFGVPGQHLLAVFAALRSSTIDYLGSRTELSAAFAADGYARAVRDRPAVLFLSTGPGALGALAALQESAAAAVPIVCIVSQVPSVGLHGNRNGLLHELPEQAAIAGGVVKQAIRVSTIAEIAPAIADAWSLALTPPYGPTWVEIPQDLLVGTAPAASYRKAVSNPGNLELDERLLARAADLLSHAERPVIIAGGGVQRGRAETELLELVERLRAPVVQTFGAKGVLEWEHPLSLQSWLEDRQLTDYLGSADVLLVVGSGLGELTTNYRTLAPSGHLLHIEADTRRIGANYPSLPLVGDCRQVLARLIELTSQREPDGIAEAEVAGVLAAIAERLDGQDLALERQVLSTVRKSVPAGAMSMWDMTILGYWAWSGWPEVRSGAMHSAQGAGGLGYALPAAIGASAGNNRPVLAVSGDGGAMYGLADLAVLRERNLPVTWLIVDDGGYGILREYMVDAFGESFGTELGRPDFVALSQSFGVPAVATTVDRLGTDLSDAMAHQGPSVVVLQTRLRMFEPTHH